MRNKPSYDWNWFNDHKPFEKIMQEHCELEVYIEKEKIPVFGNITTTQNTYHIKYNHAMFCKKWDLIKSLLLKTNICKHNLEIYEYINEMNGDKWSATRIICDGCIKDLNGRLTWNRCE